MKNPRSGGRPPAAGTLPHLRLPSLPPAQVHGRTGWFAPSPAPAPRARARAHDTRRTPHAPVCSHSPPLPPHINHAASPTPGALDRPPPPFPSSRGSRRGLEVTRVAAAVRSLCDVARLPPPLSWPLPAARALQLLPSPRAAAARARLLARLLERLLLQLTSLASPLAYSDFFCCSSAIMPSTDTEAAAFALSSASTCAPGEGKGGDGGSSGVRRSDARQRPWRWRAEDGRFLSNTAPCGPQCASDDVFLFVSSRLVGNGPRRAARW